jgi:sugar phosphate isomerase/epimerase
MDHVFSLAHLTAITLSPPELVGIAARTGYQKVGLRLIAVTPDTPGYPLMDDVPMLRETSLRMAATGVGVLDIELVRLNPDTNVAHLESFIATGAKLGARHVLAAPYDPDPNRLAETLARLADLAAQYELSVVLEFFPWTKIDRLSSARIIVDAAQRSNAGILVDTLHFARSDSTLEQLARIPAALLPFVHLCDCAADKPATVEELLHNARAERLPPSEGEIDLVGILDAMPQGIPIALEVPMRRLTNEIGHEAVARRVRDGAARVMSQVKGRPAATPTLRSE